MFHKIVTVSSLNREIYILVHLKITSKEKRENYLFTKPTHDFGFKVMFFVFFFQGCTPQKTNMEPENHPFGKEKHLLNHHFSGFHVNFQGCNPPPKRSRIPQPRTTPHRNPPVWRTAMPAGRCFALARLGDPGKNGSTSARLNGECGRMSREVGWING